MYLRHTCLEFPDGWVVQTATCIKDMKCTVMIQWSEVQTTGQVKLGLHNSYMFKSYWTQNIYQGTYQRTYSTKQAQTLRSECQGHEICSPWSGGNAFEPQSYPMDWVVLLNQSITSCQNIYHSTYFIPEDSQIAEWLKRKHLRDMKFVLPMIQRSNLDFIVYLVYHNNSHVSIN